MQIDVRLPPSIPKTEKKHSAISLLALAYTHNKNPHRAVLDI